MVPTLEAAQSCPSISVMPGGEINTDVPHGEMHISGYFVDYNDDRFNNKLQGLRNSRRERAKKMLNELRRLKMNIEWN